MIGVSSNSPESPPNLNRNHNLPFSLVAQTGSLPPTFAPLLRGWGGASPRAVLIAFSSLDSCPLVFIRGFFFSSLRRSPVASHYVARASFAFHFTGGVGNL